MINNYENLAKIGLLARIFECEKWKWINFDKAKETIPTYEEIKKHVKDLEESAYECKGIAESGRIRVEYDKELGDYNYYLVL